MNKVSIKLRNNKQPNFPKKPVQNIKKHVILATLDKQNFSLDQIIHLTPSDARPNEIKILFDKQSKKTIVIHETIIHNENYAFQLIEYFQKLEEYEKQYSEWFNFEKEKEILKLINDELQLTIDDNKYLD